MNREQKKNFKAERKQRKKKVKKYFKHNEGTLTSNQLNKLLKD